MEFNCTVLEGKHVRLEQLSESHKNDLCDAISDGELWKLNVTIVPHKAARDYWVDQATIAANGCIDPDLDQFLTDESKLNVFRSICQRIYSNLIAYGEKIPKEYLNELHDFKLPFNIREDNDTELYLLYGRALLALIDGKQSEECISA